MTVNAADDEGAAATDTDTATINVTAVAPAITIVKSVDADGDAAFNAARRRRGHADRGYQFTVTHAVRRARTAAVSAFPTRR